MSGSKKYQVFISSTYEDLKDERKAVEETIIRSGDIPVGMEAFPAADSEQFEFIKTIINQCDYYILLLAGRYGSIAPDGNSYTEKEFRFALDHGIPVLVFIREGVDILPANKVEESDAGKERLAKFVKFASKNRMRKAWKTDDGLKLAVREALDHAKATAPRPGWVRGDTIASRHALIELSDLRKINADLSKKLGDSSFSLEMPELPSIDARVRIDLISRSRGYDLKSKVTIAASYKSLLPMFLSAIVEKSSYNNDGDEWFWIDRDEACDSFVEKVAGEHSANWSLASDSFELMKSYFMEAGLLSDGGHLPVLDDIARKYQRRILVSNSGEAPNFDIVSGNFGDPDEIPF